MGIFENNDSSSTNKLGATDSPAIQQSMPEDDEMLKVLIQMNQDISAEQTKRNSRNVSFTASEQREFASGIAERIARGMKNRAAVFSKFTDEQQAEALRNQFILEWKRNGKK